ncbi:hypothetical protein ACFQS3_19555 [Glycomyces mayteni]|uniref:Uncharacterized protein n=1 Tax=Glycomyces mayteni TaxID=543887 RepID=A0ABW2DAI6_9ACTN|nr:hypothetical protein GCM10025732_04040 [Glycomyces mayteni]
MPKAAAIQPNEWATIHPNFEGFDIGSLNRVVTDYAHVELTLAKRWYRRTALGRACAVIGRIFTVIGLMAGVTLALVMLTGIDAEALLPIAYIGSGLACVAVLGFLVPWALTPYRQWDRTLCGISVMMMVCAVLALGAVIVRGTADIPLWTVIVPIIVLILVTIGAIVADVRLRTTGKPPAVDLGSLSPNELEVLLKVRHRALRILRSRNIVAYADFRGFDESPLDTPPAAES